MMTPKKMIHRIFCDHKGIVVLLKTLKNLFSDTFISENTKCFRCGKELKRSEFSIRKRKMFIKINKFIGYVIIWIFIVLMSLITGTILAMYF